MEQFRIDLPLELHAAGDASDGRTLEGRIVPYDQTIHHGGTEIAFSLGVFAEVDPESVVLLWQHDQHQPIGRMTALSEEPDGAYGRFRVGDTERAREALSLARDGILTGLSVGIDPGQTANIRGVRTHKKARLAEVSLVTFPAFPSSGVLAVHSEEEPMQETESAEVLEIAGELETQDLGWIEERFDDQSAQFREELRAVRNEIANIVTGVPEVVPPMTLLEAYTEVLRLVADNPGENHALADVIGTAPGNASGLIRDAWVTELIGYVNGLRPLFSAAGTVGFPSSGYGIAFPKVTQHTQVAKRTGEKTEVASRELTVAPVTFAMEWFAGAVDVSLELISQSDPSVVQVVVSSLMDQYALVTEDEFATDAVAAATASGAVLPTGTGAAFAAALIGESAEIRAATGVPGDRLALTTASWMAVVGLLNPSQPSISFGAGPDFTAESFGVGGISVFHAPALETDLLFNQKSLRKAERPPETVTATNVALMGRDIGILGATIALPLYPAGIHKFAAA